jgi:hypothetical protein
MMPLPPRLLELGFGTEIIYSFLIIVCSLMIYFGTKEIYELSSYKGIKYFRQAFLFFALAYFFRSFIKFIIVYFNLTRIIDFPGSLFGVETLFLFMYFSTMAIFYLLYSVMYKKWDGNPNKVYIFHALSAIIALILVIFRTNLVYLIINAILLIFVILIISLSHIGVKNKPKSHKSKLYIIYILLLIFWILNIFDILVPDFFQQFKLFLYLASSGIFLMILYKVLKKIGN